MKQVVQNLNSGELELIDVPCPQVSRGHLLIQTTRSLISAGTERSIVEFGRANLLSKVRQNPERVRQVLDRVRVEGLIPTLELVFNKLDEPMPMGYCHVGRVVEVGADVTGFQVGDRVASNGYHAEMVNKPLNLCCKIPEGVTDDQATFTVLSSIGLQGIRLIQPELGERIAVFGLGLIGLVAVQMLVANGAQVLGIDISPQRLELARQFGATTVDLSSGADPVAAAMAFTGGQGIDGVLITASAKDDTIVSQSARMSRKRGRIVLVGVVNLQLNRAEFYDKELKFQVSCSYGPGRYDEDYELRNRDYPFGFVRWTEKRNMEAILDLLAAGRLSVDPLITSTVPLAEAARAYDLVANDRSQLGIVLSYPEQAAPVERIIRRKPAAAKSIVGAGKAVIGVIGAGNYNKVVLFEQMKRSGATLANVASAGGLSAAFSSRKFDFDAATTDYRALLADPAINAVFVSTRHDQHVPMTIEALAAGKHVYLEKPAAIDRAGLARLRAAYEQSNGLLLMVGLNRRFSPHAVRMRTLLAGRSQPVTMNMLVNAGELPPTNWNHDPAIGGGRIIGEGCHFVDLMLSLVGQPIVAVQAMTIGPAPGVAVRDDKMTVTLLFADGSLGNLHYFANGHRSYPKERLEVHCEGRTLTLENFRTLRGYGWNNFRKLSFWRQDKGYAGAVQAFVRGVREGGPPVMPPGEIWNVAEATFAAVESAASGRRVELGS